MSLDVTQQTGHYVIKIKGIKAILYSNRLEIQVKGDATLLNLGELYVLRSVWCMDCNRSVS